MFFPGANEGGLFAWMVLISIGVAIYIINKNKNMNNDKNFEGSQTQSTEPAPGKGRSSSFVSPVSGSVATVQRKKSQYSPLSIFMAVILFGILVMFGERLIFDLNRFINPVIDSEYTQWKNQRDVGIRRGIDYDAPKTPVRGSLEMMQDSSNAVSQTQIYYPADEKGRYLMYKLIIHAAVIIPLFILAFALFYYKRKKLQFKPLLVSFLAFAFWMMFHLLGETISFVMNAYRNIAIYVILILLGVIFAGVTYFSQAKLHKDSDSN
jgi:hypothetical protein